MGAMAGLVAVGATLLAGLVFVATGGALTAAILRRMPGAGTTLPFKPVWRVAALAFFAGVLLGNGLTWLWGPSPATTLIGLPLYLLLFAWRLRVRFPGEFGAQRWRHTLWQVLLATLVSCIAMIAAILALRQWAG